MPERTADTTGTHQIETAVRRLDSLSILPGVAAQLLSKLIQSQSSTSALADIIESEPALTAKIFHLLHQEGVSISGERVSVRQLLGKLPTDTLRNALFSVKATEKPNIDVDEASLKKELILHSLAAACCAKDITEIASVKIDSHLAYSAGLLHDIGKLALAEVMPKSLAHIFEKAKSQNSSTYILERKQLGVDHTILGKRLSQKWHLPNQITIAIWLHHSESAFISEGVPEARIAQIVQLADLIARQCSIGQSGSYDSPDLPQKVIESLGITPEQLEQIRKNLPEAVREKSKILGLDLPKPDETYRKILQSSIAQFAKDNIKLKNENRRLRSSSSHLDFATDFLLSLNSNNLPIDIAENFAVRWQKFYQTGPVCLYLSAPAGEEFLEAVVVESLSQSKIVSLKAVTDAPLIPETAAKDLTILNAEEYAGWLLEQLDVDFNRGQAKLVPLLSAGRIIGGIVFELRYPGDLEVFAESFKNSASIATFVLDMAYTHQKQQHLAERFVELINQAKSTGQQPVPAIEHPLEALAEMAAGAAHELNNPLSVISGRAQLLAESESDEEKKKILKQIQENAGEISQIAEEMLEFAQPQPPRPSQTNIKQILDEAILLTAQKLKAEQLEIQTHETEIGKEVFVDSAQIASALANILSNAVESYDKGSGPVKVSAGLSDSSDFVKLTIQDFGCGMDKETLRKATQPFYSAKPAGRKRGMGLAYAQRLIQLNKGSLNIKSEPGKGTTVTILLPCK
ncbi:MAG: HDOD domain-containing protein [Planctomycetota bacterium]|jgi:putative nucleotidyltransferase with HDIG domain